MRRITSIIECLKKLKGFIILDPKLQRLELFIVEQFAFLFFVVFPPHRPLCISFTEFSAYKHTHAPTPTHAHTHTHTHTHTYYSIQRRGAESESDAKMVEKTNFLFIVDWKLPQAPPPLRCNLSLSLYDSRLLPLSLFLCLSLHLSLSPSLHHLFLCVWLFMFHNYYPLKCEPIFSLAQF